MQEFKIDCCIENVPTTYERGLRVKKLLISEEWTIVCVTTDHVSVHGLPYAKFNFIEIHRKNTTGKCVVSGEFRIMQCGSQIFQKTFSQSVETGSSFTVICSNMDLSDIYQPFWLQGFVKISNIREKQQVSLENEDTQLKIELNSLKELSNDFERLLHPESSCPADITLKCNGVSIPAHKTILSARSPVFAAMFAHPMKENLKNEVDITDIDESTLRALLKYMYTGKNFDPTVDSAAELLFAADKYQLRDLKAVCSFHLKDSVSPQNVWKILGLGDMYSAHLKTFAVDYICNNCGEFSVIEKTNEWKDLRKERPDLTMELLESLVKYREGNMKD